MNRGGPQMFHSFFTDDLVFIIKASQDHVQVVQEYLKMFCEYFG